MINYVCIFLLSSFFQNVYGYNCKDKCSKGFGPVAAECPSGDTLCISNCESRLSNDHDECSDIEYQMQLMDQNELTPQQISAVYSGEANEFVENTLTNKKMAEALNSMRAEEAAGSIIPYKMMLLRGAISITENTIKNYTIKNDFLDDGPISGLGDSFQNQQQTIRETLLDTSGENTVQNNSDYNFPVTVNPVDDPVGHLWDIYSAINFNEEFNDFTFKGLSVEKIFNVELSKDEKLSLQMIRENAKSLMQDYAEKKYSIVVNNPFYGNFVSELSSKTADRLKNVDRFIKKYKIKLDQEHYLTKIWNRAYRNGRLLNAGELEEQFKNKMIKAAEIHKKIIEKEIKGNKQYATKINTYADIDTMGPLSDLFSKISERYMFRYKSGMLLAQVVQKGHTERRNPSSVSKRKKIYKDKKGVHRR